MTKQEKINVINSMQVADYSCSIGECEYVVTKETDEKVKVLREMGMTDEHYEQMTEEKDYLDISYFAFNVLGATWWSKKEGFSLK